MARLDERIIEFIKNNGPATPIEIASKIGTNSIIATAIMIDACSNQKLKRSKRKVGGSMKLYYAPGQEKEMRKRISSLLTPQDKELLEKLMKEKIISEIELEPIHRVLFSNLEDLINVIMVNHNGASMKSWYVPELDEENARKLLEERLKETKKDVEEPVKEVEKEEEKAEQKIEEIRKEEERKSEEVEKSEKEEKSEEYEEKEQEIKKDKKTEEEKKPKQKRLGELKSEFREKVLRWFEKREITVDKEKTIEEGNEYELEVKVPTPLGSQNYLVKVIDLGKKKLGKSILEPIAMDAVGKRTPIIVISKTGFAKNARKYRDKQVDDLVKLVSKDDLE